MASPPIIITNIRVRRAKEAANSLDSLRDSSQRFREVWQELRRSYEDIANSNPTTYQPFPLWAPSQFNPERLEGILTVGYYKDLGYLATWASYALQTFNVVAWQFVLFFDHIEQARARAIGKIARARPSLTIARLYEEVESNRLHRIGRQRNPRHGFQPSDFKTCLNGSDNDDGSDAEFTQISDDDEEENEITVAEDNDSESEDAVWSPDENPGLDDQGIDNIVEHHIQSISDQDVEESDGHDDRSDSSSLRSIVIIQDGTEVPEETNAAGVTANEVNNETRERDMSPEQPSLLDPHSSGGNSISVEKQLLQRAPTILEELTELVAASDTAAEHTKIIGEKIKANMKEMNQAVLQVLECNISASSEDLMAAVVPVFSDLEKQQRKRKVAKENISEIDAKKAKLCNELAAKSQKAKPKGNV